jgi:hypothetical protein
LAGLIVFAKFRATLRRISLLAERALQCELLEACCVSFVDGKPLSLPRQFVRDASEIVIELTVRKPIVPQLAGHSVQVEVRALDGRSLTGLESSQTEKGMTGRLAQIRMMLSGPALARQSGLRVSVLCRRPRRLLDAFDFRGLGQDDVLPYTQDLILRNLHVEDQGLWIEAGQIRYRSDQVPASSDAVAVILLPRSTGFNAYLPEWETTLTLSALFGGNRRLPLCQTPITLSERSRSTRTLTVPVRESALASLPAGLCWLVASVAGHDVAALPFRLVSEQELLDQVRVSQLAVDTLAQDGRCARKVTVLRRDFGRFVQVSVVLETSILAPNTAFPGAVVWSRGDAILRREAFSLKLDRWSQHLVLQTIALAELGLGDPSAPDQLSIAVCLGPDLKRAIKVLVLPDQRITNFEGQLILDPEDLVVHEAEYDDILYRLDPAGRSLPGRIQPK